MTFALSPGMPVQPSCDGARNCVTLYGAGQVQLRPFGGLEESPLHVRDAADGGAFEVTAGSTAHTPSLAHQPLLHIQALPTQLKLPGGPWLSSHGPV